MNVRSELLLSFLAAVILHLMTALAVGAFLLDSRTDLLPVFETGVSSVEISFIAPPVPRPVQADLELAPMVQEETEPEEAQPVVDDGVVMEGNITSEIRPRYPMGARIRGEEGIVAISVTTDASGHVTDAQVVEGSSFPALNSAALDSVRRSVFRSATTGLPASGKTTLRIRFQLLD